MTDPEYLLVTPTPFPFPQATHRHRTRALPSALSTLGLSVCIDIMLHHTHLNASALGTCSVTGLESNHGRRLPASVSQWGPPSN